MVEQQIGIVSDFFARPVVAGIELTGMLKVGDVVRIKGHTTDLQFTVDSMQIEHQNVAEAGPGASVGIRVPDRVRKDDKVFKVTP